MVAETSEIEVEEEGEAREELYGLARLGLKKSQSLYDTYLEIHEECVSAGRTYNTRCYELETIKNLKRIEVYNGQKTVTLERDSMNDEEWAELHQSMHSHAIAQSEKAKEKFRSAIGQSIKRLQGELLGE